MCECSVCVSWKNWCDDDWHDTSMHMQMYTHVLTNAMLSNNDTGVLSGLYVSQAIRTIFGNQILFHPMPAATPQESPLEDAMRRKRREDYLHLADANAVNPYF